MTRAVALIGRVFPGGLDAGRRFAAGGGRFALWAFSIRVAAAGLAFVTQIVLARLIGEDAYGEVAAAVTVLAVATAVAIFGLDTGAQRFVAHYRAVDDPARLRGFLRLAAVVPVCVGAVLGAAGVAVFWNRDPVLATAFATLPVVALLLTKEAVAKSCDWPVAALAPNYLLRPILLLALAAGAGAAGIALDATGVMLAMLAAAVIALAVQTLLLRPRLARIAPAGPRLMETRHWLVVATPILIGDIGALVAVSVDVIALSIFRPSEEAGIYFAAVKSLALVQFVAYAVTNAVAHRVSALHVSGDRAGLRAYVLRACLATFVPSLAFAALVVGFGETVLGLFGEAFVSAWPAMVVVAIGSVALAAVGPAERVLNMIGRERACARVYVASGLLATALALALVPAHGAMGAAATLALTMLFQAVALALALRAALR